MSRMVRPGCSAQWSYAAGWGQGAGLGWEWVVRLPRTTAFYSGKAPRNSGSRPTTEEKNAANVWLPCVCMGMATSRAKTCSISHQA